MSAAERLLLPEEEAANDPSYPQKQIDVVATDLDDTLVGNWVHYLALALDETRQILCEKTKHSRQIITMAMQRFFAEANTMDCSWLVQGLVDQGIVKRTHQEELIHLIRASFKRVREEHLKAHPEAGGLIQFIRNNLESLLLVLSDAPGYSAARRLEKLGEDMLSFDGTMAQPDPLLEQIPTGFEIDPSAYSKLPLMFADRPKPHANITPIVRHLKGPQASPGRIIMIGNSHADILQAKSMRAKLAILAHNWFRLDPKLLALLLEFVPKKILGEIQERNAGVVDMKTVEIAESPEHAAYILERKITEEAA